jgi:hypothetical protein
MVAFFVEILHLMTGDVDLFNLIARMVCLVSGGAIEKIAHFKVIHPPTLPGLHEFDILYNKGGIIDD